jgi:hypothetical protein
MIFFVCILCIKDDITIIGFLQGFVQVKVDNLVYIINLSSENAKCKELNTISSPVATTI